MREQKAAVRKRRKKERENGRKRGRAEDWRKER
jgi:hypothetical protein